MCIVMKKRQYTGDNNAILHPIGKPEPEPAPVRKSCCCSGACPQCPRCCESHQCEDENCSGDCCQNSSQD
ncbi:hypothetical protein EWB00_005300 [Schistosoma japonicum]|uniref:Uncharacterized protein n=1 Tax=Schistosoma japonicum TaxID=6182 RepID=A0A4Z2D304_SCHJA|nr:hypothetical protein EWB00_005300 [Schistosoma japonicum]